MKNPEERIKDVGEIFRKRKKWVLLTSVPFFVLAAVALLSRIASGRFLGIPFSIAGPVAYISFLATFVAHILIWRCPACDRYLGVVGSSVFCPKCGTRLNGGVQRVESSRDRRLSVKSALGFKIWTALLSAFVAVMLFPNIVGKHGFAKSFVITALAVGAVWGMYFAIGSLINRAVAEELKRRERKREGGSKEPPAGEGA